jgi:hypothetical protein
MRSQPNGVMPSLHQVILPDVKGGVLPSGHNVERFEAKVGRTSARFAARAPRLLEYCQNLPDNLSRFEPRLVKRRKRRAPERGLQPASMSERK